MSKLPTTATAAILMLLSARALAQDPANQTAPASPVPPAASEGESSAPSTEAAEVTAEADQIIGKQLISSDEEEVGEITGVLVTSQGQVEAIILQQSGTIGMGGRTVAVAWDKLKILGDQITVEMTSDELEGLAEYHMD
jgi:sporulation protein YlmC with PRC-barrel domain